MKNEVGGETGSLWRLRVMEIKAKTNADRIREMTDEELAIFLGDVDCCNPNHCEPGMYCEKCWLDWLRSPVEESDE